MPQATLFRVCVCICPRSATTRACCTPWMRKVVLLAALAVVLTGVGAATLRARVDRSPGSPEGMPPPGTVARLEEYEKKYLWFVDQRRKNPQSFKPSGTTSIVTEMRSVPAEVLEGTGLEAIAGWAQEANDFASIIAAAMRDAEGSEDAVSYRALNPASLAGMTDEELSAEREANARFAGLTVELLSDVDKVKGWGREESSVELEAESSDSNMYRGMFLHYLGMSKDYPMRHLVAEMMVPLLTLPRDRVVWYMALVSELPGFCMNEQTRQLFLYDLRLVGNPERCPLHDINCMDVPVAHLADRIDNVMHPREAELSSSAARAVGQSKRDYSLQCWKYSEDYTARFEHAKLASTLAGLSQGLTTMVHGKNAWEHRIRNVLALHNPAKFMFSLFTLSGDTTELFYSIHASFLELASCVHTIYEVDIDDVFRSSATEEAKVTEDDLCHQFDVTLEKFRRMIRLAVVFIEANGGHESPHYDTELLLLRVMGVFAGMKGEDWMGVVDEHRNELCMRLLTHGVAGYSQVDHRDVWKERFALFTDITHEVADMCRKGLVKDCDVSEVELPNECLDIMRMALFGTPTLASQNEEFVEKLKKIEAGRTSWQHFLLKRSFNLRGEVPSASGNAAVIPSVLTKIGAGRVPDQTFRPIDTCIVQDHLSRLVKDPDPSREGEMYYKSKLTPEEPPEEMIPILANLIRRKFQTHRLQDLKSFEHCIFDDVSNSNIFMNGLGTDRSGRRGRKTLTNIGVSLEMFGDCREHANAMTAMYAYWSSRQMLQILQHHLHLARQGYDSAMGLTAYYEGDGDVSAVQPPEIAVEEMDPHLREEYERTDDSIRRGDIMYRARERAQEKAAQQAYLHSMDEGAMLEKLTNSIRNDVRGIHGEFYVPGVVSQMYDVKHTPEGHGILRRVEFKDGTPQLTDYEKDAWGKKNFWVCEGDDGRKQVFLQGKENSRRFSQEEQEGCVLYVLAEEHTFTILATRENDVKSYPTLNWDNDEVVKFQFADSFYSHVHDTVKVEDEFSLDEYTGRMKTAMGWMDGFESETGRDKRPHERSPMSLGYTGDNYIEPFCKDPEDCQEGEGYTVHQLFRANAEEFLDESTGEHVPMPIYWRPTDFSGKIFQQGDNSFEEYNAMEIGLRVEGFRPTFEPRDLQAMREYQARLLFWYCGEREGTDNECYTSKVKDEALRTLFGRKE